MFRQIDCLVISRIYSAQHFEGYGLGVLLSLGLLTYGFVSSKDLLQLESSVCMVWGPQSASQVSTQVTSHTTEGCDAKESFHVLQGHHPIFFGAMRKVWKSITKPKSQTVDD